jgi:hypothetical protein
MWISVRVITDGPCVVIAFGLRITRQTLQGVWTIARENEKTGAIMSGMLSVLGKHEPTSMLAHAYGVSKACHLT